MGGTREGLARENLHSYPHFLSWCEQAGLAREGEVQRLREQEVLNPYKGAAVLGRAIALREAIYKIFFAIAQGNAPSTRDIEVLNTELALGLGRLRVGTSGEGRGFSWQWAEEPMELDHGLGPIAYAAAGLLACDGDLEHIRQCKAENCGWLFLDSSKNHSRCWCDMRDCGNRAKVRRHRRKRRESDSGS